MDKKIYYKYLFLIGALFNWVIGLMFIFASIFMTFLFPLFLNFTISSLVFFQLLFASVIIMGIGNYWFSRDITKSQDAVKMCCISRFLFFGVITYYWLIGDLSILVFLSVIVSLIIGILYIEFFVNFKKIQ